MREHGFWDYTTPGAGGMEGYGADDYRCLLDDMAEAGMNSLLVCVKWLTTGYRSRLPFMDQVAENRMIASDNELLRWTISAAKARGIRVWLSAFVAGFDAERGGPGGFKYAEQTGGYRLPIRCAFYDLDAPGFFERAAAVFEELVDLFPGIAGLNVEVEESGWETPRRLEPYNRWAEANKRLPADRLGRPINPRNSDTPAWRDYTTHRRVELMQHIERALRARGFAGDLAMICETYGGDYVVTQEVNLQMFHAALPNWAAVTYEYDKWHHRRAMMDLCLAQPRLLGLKRYYLPRGVMTWHRGWPMPITLEESWRMDAEDVAQFPPDGLWWFGSGCGDRDGAHVDRTRLRQSGYGDGVAARRALLRQIRPFRLERA